MIKIEFTEQELQTIIYGLGKLPLEQSVELFMKIKLQYENSKKSAETNIIKKSE